MLIYKHYHIRANAVLKCGQIGERNDKLFKCPCGHVENADSNAAFNIAFLSPSILQLQKEKRFLQTESDTR